MWTFAVKKLLLGKDGAFADGLLQTALRMLELPVLDFLAPLLCFLPCLVLSDGHLLRVQLMHRSAQVLSGKCWLDAPLFKRREKAFGQPTLHEA